MKPLRIPYACIIVLIVGCNLAITRNVAAQDASSKKSEAGANLDQPADDQTNLQQLLKKFEQRMSGSKLVGRFTIDARESENSNVEEYHILNVRKLEKGDYWEFKARIKYGDHDLTVPIPVEVKWAGNTPVITVDQLTIPGLGTFDARVLLRKDKYAGTWSHDNVGGHMFGRIEKMSDEDLKTPSKSGSSSKQPGDK